MSAPELRAYAGEHAERKYGAEALRRDPARGYLCAVCAGPAAYWDHCHDHRLIRGPLCRRCNTIEPHWHRYTARSEVGGYSLPPDGMSRREFARRGFGHLRSCRACAERGALPSKHIVGLALARLGPRRAACGRSAYEALPGGSAGISYTEPTPGVLAVLFMCFHVPRHQEARELPRAELLALAAEQWAALGLPEPLTAWP